MLSKKTSAFTLIELSIVLVIIGLIVGGVLVGRDLIKASEIRAQISQIEKFHQAVNTFRGKFGDLPGDLTVASATQFGFAVGGANGTQGARDGNGLIESNVGGYVQQAINEPGYFWQDLTTSRLIDGSYPAPGSPAIFFQTTVGAVSLAAGPLYVGNYFPLSKIAPDNFIYAYSYQSVNWFGLSAVTVVNSGNAALASSPTLPVIQAYNIDKKIDDGTTGGNVQPIYVNGIQFPSVAPNTATIGGTAASCYDTTTYTYSITPNNGVGRNCALSFKFQ